MTSLNSFLSQYFLCFFEFLLKNQFSVVTIFCNLGDFGVHLLYFLFGLIIEVGLESKLVLETHYFSKMLRLFYLQLVDLVFVLSVIALHSYDLVLKFSYSNVLTLIEIKLCI